MPPPSDAIATRPSSARSFSVAHTPNASISTAIALAVLMLAFGVWSTLKLRALEGRMAMATLGGGTTTRRPSAPAGSAAQTVRPGAAHRAYTHNPAGPALDADGYVSSAEMAASGVSLDAEGYVSSAELASGV